MARVSTGRKPRPCVYLPCLHELVCTGRGVTMHRLAAFGMLLCGVFLAFASWMPAGVHAAQTPPPSWIDAAIAQANRNSFRPPANFDATTASDQDLAKYGIPPRPTDPPDLPTCTTIATHSNYRAFGLVR